MDGHDSPRRARAAGPEHDVGDRFRIELARPRDAESIARMSRTHIEAGLRPTWPADRVAARVREAEAIVIKAVEGGLLAGFAVMGFGLEEAHLELLAVSAARQRLGVGRILVRWLEESALVAGVSVVRLELRATNAGALQFYERLGYRRFGRVRNYYQGREDAICMARDLWEDVTAHAD